MASENLDNLGFSDEATYLRASSNKNSNITTNNKEEKGFIAGTGVKTGGRWW